MGGDWKKRGRGAGVGRSKKKGLGVGGVWKNRGVSRQGRTNKMRCGRGLEEQGRGLRGHGRRLRQNWGVVWAWPEGPGRGFRLVGGD